jgi:Tol biopolymer transport system component
MKYSILHRYIFLLFFSFIFLHDASAKTHGYGSWLSDIEGENAGHTVAYFLTLPVSASELGIGNASCGDMEASDVYSYTANTAFFDRKKISITHLEWLMGIRKEFVAACFPVEDMGTFGLYTQALTPGSFENAYTIDETPSHPSMLDYSLGLTAARDFMHHSISVGGGISYIESRLDGSTGRTLCLNADVLAVPSPFVSMHLICSNIGPGVSYAGNVTEYLPLKLGCAASFRPLALEEELSGTIDPYVNFGVCKISDEPVDICGGIQARIFDFVNVRTGYEYSLDRTQAFIEGFSLGAGVEEKNFGADIGWKGESEDFGSVWSVSVNARLKPMIRKKAEDYYYIAQQYYGKGRLRQSLSNAMKAIALDPNLWKAQVLISTINSMKRRANGSEIALIYTGNINGSFSAEQGRDGITGGLARQVTLIDGLRSEFRYSLALDAGNFMAKTSVAAKASAIGYYFRRCGYNAAGLGKGDMDFGLDTLFARNASFKNGYLCTNIHGANVKPERSVALCMNGYSFYVISVTGQGRPESEYYRAHLSDPATDIKSMLDNEAAGRSTIRILMIDDSWERIQDIAASFPQIDIIICGGLKQRFETPMKSGNAIILSTGYDGKCVGRLILRFARNKKLSSCDNHLFAVDDNVIPDSSMAAMLRSLPGSGNNADEYADVLAHVKPEGVFAFVSDRDGVPGIYLKVMDKLSEFPLTRGMDSCGRPEVSFTAGKCAYMEKTADGSCARLRIMALTGSAKTTVPFNGCITGYRFSPDGIWLYFSGKNDSSGEDIFRIRPDGRDMQPVISWKKSSERYFDFSPDGLNMIFGSDGNGKRQLFLTDTIGRRPICITEGNADNIMPVFSPDGRKIAYLSDLTSFNGTYDLWIYSMETGKAGRVTVNSGVSKMIWLDDSHTIAFSSGNDSVSRVRIVDIMTGQVRMLVPIDTSESYSEHSPETVKMKDGVRIAYTREYRNGDRDIYIVNKDGTGNTLVVKGKNRDWIE